VLGTRPVWVRLEFVALDIHPVQTSCAFDQEEAALTQRTKRIRQGERWPVKPGHTQFLFQGRKGADRHLTTRQYARLLDGWLGDIGLDPSLYGTHSLRRTKATMIYKRTGNLRAVQLLLGHTKIESTVRYLGIEVNDALEIAEQTDV
jgi:integrase